jgi:hypothetical protein
MFSLTNHRRVQFENFFVAQSRAQRQQSELTGRRDLPKLNPASGVPPDAMSKEQTFRSEGNGSLPLSGRRSSVVQDEI